MRKQSPVFNLLYFYGHPNKSACILFAYGQCCFWRDIKCWIIWQCPRISLIYPPESWFPHSRYQWWGSVWSLFIAYTVFFLSFSNSLYLLHTCFLDIAIFSYTFTSSSWMLVWGIRKQRTLSPLCLFFECPPSW